MSSQQRDSGGGRMGIHRGGGRAAQPGIRTNVAGRQQYGRSRGGGASGASQKKVIPIDDDSGSPTPSQQPVATSWANVVKKQGSTNSLPQRTQVSSDKPKIVAIGGGSTSNGDTLPQEQRGQQHQHAQTPSGQLQFGELPQDLNLAANGDTQNGGGQPENLVYLIQSQNQVQQQQQQSAVSGQQVSIPQQQQMMAPQQQPAPGMPPAPQMYQFPPWQYFTTPPNQMQFYSAQQQQEYTAWYHYYRQFMPPQEYGQWPPNPSQAGYPYQPYPMQQGVQQQPQQSQQSSQPYSYTAGPQGTQQYPPRQAEPEQNSNSQQKGEDGKEGVSPEKPKIVIKRPTSGAIPIVNPGTNEVIKVTPATATAMSTDSQEPMETLNIQVDQKGEQEKQNESESQAVQDNCADVPQEKESLNDSSQQISEVQEKQQVVVSTPTMAQVMAQIPEKQPEDNHNPPLQTKELDPPNTTQTVDNNVFHSLLEASASPYTPQYIQPDMNNEECNGVEVEEQPERPYCYDRVTLLKLQFTDIEQSEELSVRLNLPEFQALVSRKSYQQQQLHRVPSGISRKNSVDKWSRYMVGRLEGTRSGGLDRWNSASREQLSNWSTRKQSPAPARTISNPNIHKSTNAYKVGNISDDEEAKQRLFQSYLNKLTPTNFDKIYQQIIAVEITSPETLKGLIHQIFDKALVETSFSPLYSDLCKRLTDDLPAFPEPDLQEQPPSAQPQKKRMINFRRLLLNKCQEEFEKGQYAMQNTEDDAKKQQPSEETKIEEAKRKANELKDRRRALGNMQFIGYLFSKGMLTEQILHDCIQLLLKDLTNPKGEDLEQLCKLLFTVGALLDSPKAKMKENMGVYMKRIMSLTNNQQLDSRIKFMLIEVVETRQRGWEARRKVEGPKTIKEIRKDAAADMKRASSSKDLPSARKYKSSEVVIPKSRIPTKQEEFKLVDRSTKSSSALPTPQKTLVAPKPHTQNQGVWSSQSRTLITVNSEEQEEKTQQSGDDEQQTDYIRQQLRDWTAFSDVQNEIKMLLEEFQISLEHKLQDQEAVDDALQKFIIALEQQQPLFQQNDIPKTNTFHWILEISLGKRHFKEFLWVIVRYFTNNTLELQKLSGDIESSIKLAIHCAYKYCEDNPFYSTMLGFILSKFVENGVLDFRKIGDFILQAGDKEREEDPPPLLDEGAAIPIICETIKGLIDLMGLHETQEIWTNSGFQIHQFAPEGDDFVIKTTVKQCGLEPLFPSYK